MSRLYNFEEYSIVSSLNEALQVDVKEQGKKKVNIITGRFQPFTKGHVKIFEQMYKENGLPTVIVLVKGKNQDKAKNPFDTDTQMTLFAEMKKEYSNLLEACYVIEGGVAIDKLFNLLRPAYEPVLWGCGTDRKKAYDYQVFKPEYREQLNCLDELSTFEIKRTDEDISASKVREAIKIDDEKTYQQMMPKSLWEMYPVLSNILNNNQ